jgi:aryl-alcohol dehydrogenase-like predicted oxidoreductase
LVEYSPIILGGLFGYEDEAVYRSRLDTLAELGGRTIDTSPLHDVGASDEMIGRWMAERRSTIPREEWRIVSKACHHTEDGRPRLRPDVLRAEVTDSLRRLRTDYLDAVLLHRDDPGIPVHVLTDTLLELRDQGMIRDFGVSNWSAERLAAFAGAVAPLRPIASYQFSLAVPARPLWPGSRHVTADILEVVTRHQLCLQGWTALSRGWFAGRDPDDRTGLDRELLLAFDTPANRAARTAVFSIASRHGVTPVAVALSWVLSAGIDAHAVIGPRSPAQLRECFGGAEFTLAPAEWEELSEAAGVPWVPGPGGSARH